MAILVPKGLEPWPAEHSGFRVEYLDRSGAADRATGSLLRRVYFESEEEASAFAHKHTTWGFRPCEVECRDLPATHEVHHIEVDTGRVLSIRRFCDLKSALTEFMFGKTRARKHGGRCELREVGNDHPISIYTYTPKPRTEKP